MVHTGIHIRHSGQLRGQLVNLGLGNRHQHHERKVTSQLGRLRFSNIATHIGHILGHVRYNSKSITTDGIDNQLFRRKETSLKFIVVEKKEKNEIQNWLSHVDWEMPCHTN
jgi:hypothetical protein